MNRPDGLHCGDARAMALHEARRVIASQSNFWKNLNGSMVLQNLKHKRLQTDPARRIKSISIVVSVTVLHELTQCENTVLDYALLHYRRYMPTSASRAEQVPFQQLEVMMAICRQQRRPAIMDIIQGRNAQDQFQIQRFVLERRLYFWLLSANTRGQTPTMATLLEQMVMFLPTAWKDIPTWNNHLEALASNPRAQESWARKFRKDWMLKYNELSIQPPLSDETITLRVRTSFWIFLSTHGHEFVCASGRKLNPF